jgi:cyclopropane fatty-acyl-phospholipid synthase-like methyltransferase
MRNMSQNHCVIKFDALRYRNCLRCSSQMYSVARRLVRSDYIRTLRVWLERLCVRQGEIEVMTKDGTFEFSERYLRRSIYGFEKKQLQLCRFVFQRY